MKKVGAVLLLGGLVAGAGAAAYLMLRPKPQDQGEGQGGRKGSGFLWGSGDFLEPGKMPNVWQMIKSLPHTQNVTLPKWAADRIGSGKWRPTPRPHEPTVQQHVVPYTPPVLIAPGEEPSRVANPGLTWPVLNRSNSITPTLANPVRVSPMPILVQETAAPVSSRVLTPTLATARASTVEVMPGVISGTAK